MDPMHPILLDFAFILVLGWAISLFILSIKTSKSPKSHLTIKWILGLMGLWALISGALASQGFYDNPTALPPRLGVALLPACVFGVVMLIKKPDLIYRFNPTWLILIFTARIGVELLFVWLFQLKEIPELMTFEGRNFDILAGILSPFVAYYGYQKKSLSKASLFLFNLLGLGLLINIVFYATASTVSPFQLFAFDQPNTAFFWAPWIFLPALLVPLVFFAHLVLLIRLAKGLDGRRQTNQTTDR